MPVVGPDNHHVAVYAIRATIAHATFSAVRLIAAVHAKQAACWKTTQEAHLCNLLSRMKPFVELHHGLGFGF
jgi:hypothetical protein